MKKRSKGKDGTAQGHDGTDVAGLILKVQQQLTFLDKKVDALISQISTRPAAERQEQRPFQRFEQPGHRPDQRQGNDFRQRTLHKAICADCNKECEVPFRPSGDRPVYCKECFGKRKAGGTFKARPEAAPREKEPIPVTHFDKRHGSAHRKPGGKKAHGPRRRKGT